ncbi:hypothetical protein CFN78_10955 [Amycolatopsis antarctica]|uniref:Lipoprotein n=1 Tax=Amycolatopsis antarctica TaxID=1854586 RepID=A0A263D7H4_9PSEU|nr:hypothetical protein [Amycolatopsis antarctica]OZM73355.1 hypothetical protein CFN78_10955 [Amycolatopsis antarctica]
MTKRPLGIIAAACLIGFSAAGCTDAINEAVDSAGNVKDKAGACAEALGLTSFDPTSLDPEQLAAKAGEKAEQARQLGGRVAEQDLQQTLFGIADGYVELEQRQAKGIGTINEWVQRNAGNLDRLRQVCL